MLEEKGTKAAQNEKDGEDVFQLIGMMKLYVCNKCRIHHWKVGKVEYTIGKLGWVGVIFMFFPTLTKPIS